MECHQYVPSIDNDEKDSEMKSDVSTKADAEYPLAMPFPIMCIRWFPNQVIFASGGGGPTKSGVQNGFEILQFLNVNNGNQNEQKKTAYELNRHSWYKTGGDIIHSIVQHPRYKFQFIAAVANSLAIIEMSSKFTPKQQPFAFEWNQSQSQSHSHSQSIVDDPNPNPNPNPIRTLLMTPELNSKALEFEHVPKSVLAIAVHPSGKWIASGGTDGIVRLWKYNFVNLEFRLQHEIDISRLHYQNQNQNVDKEEGNDEQKMNSQSSLTQSQPQRIPIAIERLLFDTMHGIHSEYLSICIGESSCYIWKLHQTRMEIILCEPKQPDHYIFRECAFIADRNSIQFSLQKLLLNTRDMNKFCVCAVNTNRNALGSRKKRRRMYLKSYLYQYFVNSDDNDHSNGQPQRHAHAQWNRTNVLHIENATVKRMICCSKTYNIITLHTNGVICIIDGLRLTKKYSFENKGTFYMDIAVSNGYGNQANNYQEYLLIALTKSIILRSVKLDPCQSTQESGRCYGSNLWIFSILVLIIAVLANAFQNDFF